MTKLMLVPLMVLLTSCSSYGLNKVPCPVRPILEPYTSEELRRMDIDVMEKIGANQIRMKEYAKKLEVRARCER